MACQGKYVKKKLTTTLEARFYLYLATFSFTAIKMPIVRMMIQVIRDVDKIPDNVQMKYLCQFSRKFKSASLYLLHTL